MFIVTHASVGATIGFFSGNIFVSFFGGLLSHHILDVIPHFDRGSLCLKKSKAGSKYLNFSRLIPNSEKLNFLTGKLSIEELLIIIPDIIITFLAVVFLFWFLSLNQFVLIFVGISGAIFPDVLSALFLFCPQITRYLPMFHKYQKLHNFFHWTVARKHIGWGILTQFLVLISIISFLIFKIYI